MNDNREAMVREELGRAFQVWNKGLFGGNLPQPTFLFMPDRKPMLTLAHDGRSVIVGAAMAEAKKAAIHEQLVHVMVHMDNLRAGHRDCTSNEYHNSRFLDGAVRAGFYVSRHRSKGWEVTTFLPPAHDDEGDGIKFNPDCVKRRRATFASGGFESESFAATRAHMRVLVEKAGKPKKCFLKYVCGCPSPHNSIRSGRRPTGRHPLQATCNVCHQEFRYTEE